MSAIEAGRKESRGRRFSGIGPALDSRAVRG
jgi:hypothetical protein